MPDRSGPPLDEPAGMVPVRRGTVVGIVVVTVVSAIGAAIVWRATFPDIDEGDDRPPSLTLEGGGDATD